MGYTYKLEDFTESDRVKIIVSCEPELIYTGKVTEIEEDGFWWDDFEGENEEYLTFCEIENVTSIEITELEKCIELFLSGKNFLQFERLASGRKTTIHKIIEAFVNDLLATDQSGGSDERDLAYQWLNRNCIGREFMR
jgi:hypothetical protein